MDGASSRFKGDLVYLNANVFKFMYVDWNVRLKTKGRRTWGMTIAFDGRACGLRGKKVPIMRVRLQYITEIIVERL